MKTRLIYLLFSFSALCLFNTCSKEEPKDNLTVPNAPTSLAAIAVSTSQINLTWNDNSTNESGFKIERSPDNANWSEIATVGSGVSSFQNTGLTGSTTYYYRARAYNAAGSSAYTSSVNATTQAPPLAIPAAPSSPSASAVSSTQINFSWTDNSNNETGFRIERSPNNSTWAEITTVGSNITSYQNTGLSASTIYYYRVRSYNGAGNSAYTTSVNATTQAPPVTIPTAPSNPAASAISSTQINFSWTDNSNNETGFRIERSPNNSTWAEITTVGSNITSYQNTGLIASTLYYYRVRAYNGAGNSAYTSPVNATTHAAATVPSISAPATSTGTFTVTMTYPFSGTLGSTSDGYYLEESTSPTTGFSVVASVTNTRQTSWTKSLTKPTGTYYYRVRVYNMNGYSPYSAIISVTVNVPVAKATLRITNNTKYDMIDIKLNNTQYINTVNTGVLIGNSYSVEFSSSGSVTYYLGVGFWNGTSRNVWFYLSGTANVTLGSTTNVTFNNPTIAQMLSGFSSSKNWNGYYFDAASNYKTCRFNFTSSGGWTFYDGTVQNGSGSVILVSWPNYATIITFKICSSCADIQLAYPFGSFMYRNGPPSWPIIEYTGQK